MGSERERFQGYADTICSKAEAEREQAQKKLIDLFKMAAERSRDSSAAGQFDAYYPFGEYFGAHYEPRSKQSIHEMVGNNASNRNAWRINGLKKEYIRIIIRDVNNNRGKKYIPPLLAYLSCHREVLVEFCEYCQIYLRPKPAQDLLEAASSPSEAPEETLEFTIEPFDTSLLRRAPPQTPQRHVGAPVPPSTLTQMQTATRQYAEDLLRDHEKHELEKDFDVFRRSNISGYWHICAGPGMGKTSILASLYDAHAKTIDVATIGHFFRGDGTAPAGNSFDLFYHNVLTALANHFECEETVPDSESGKVALFRQRLFELSSKGQVTRDRPLVIVIDGLDEMTPRGRQQAFDDNDLELPPSLPEHVYIISSRRQSKISAQDNWLHRAAAKVDFLMVDTSDADSYTKHKHTVQRYVERACEVKVYIAPYHRITGASAKNSFLKELCERAGYNFMILRAVLNDRGYWESGLGLDHITPDLTGYYREQFKRMQHADPQRRYGAIFCLALLPSISFGTFAQLVTSAGVGDVPEDVLETIDQWRAQGFLLLRRDVNGVDWLGVFHQSFWEFLNTRLKEQASEAILLPFANRMRSVFEQDTGFLALKQMAPSLIAERIALLLVLHRQAKLLLHLSRFLQDLAFAQVCSRAEKGLTVMFDHLRDLRPQFVQSDVEQMLDEAAVALLRWTAEGLLEPIYGDTGDVRGAAKLFDLGLAVEIGMRHDGSLSLTKSLIAVSKDLELLDQDRSTLIARLFSVLKAARRRNDVPEAWAVARELEPLLTDEDAVFRSRLYYDMGMLHHVDGNYTQSVELLKISADVAYSAGDTVRGLFSAYRQYLNAYLGGSITVSDLYARLVEILSRAEALETEARIASDLMENTLYNLTVSIGQVAFDAAPEDFERWHERVMKLPFTVAELSKPPHQRNPNYDYFRIQSLARYHQIQGRFERAAQFFAAYLDVEITCVTPEELEGFEDIFRPFTRDETMEICRDYRDLARALIAIGTPEALADAHLVYARARQFPDTKGNGFFVRQMDEDFGRVAAKI